MSLLDANLKRFDIPNKMSMADTTKFYKLDVTEKFLDWCLYLREENQPFMLSTEWNSERLKFVIHPSSVDNPCDFYLYLQLLGEEEERKVRPSSQMIMDTGTAVHGQMQYLQITRALRKGYRYEPEVGFRPEKNKNCGIIRVGGHADGVSIGWPCGCPIVWEYKTISRKGFERLTSPHKGYVKQVHLYMLALGAPAAIIVYICKDNSEIKAFKLRFEEDIWEPLLERLLHIRKCTVEMKDPDKRIGPACRRCGYLKVCEPDLSNVKEFGRLPKSGMS